MLRPRTTSHAQKGVSYGPPWLLLTVALTSFEAAGCGGSPPPEALVELRRALSEPTLARGREAAPDLVAEAERSLALAERALARGDEATARRTALLGSLQARTAWALARQHSARAREEMARHELEEAREAIARYRSQRSDALREIQRLEALNPGRAPDDGALDPAMADGE